MSENLICAFNFSATGKASAISEDKLFAPLPKSGWRWLHFDRTGDKVRNWLFDDKNISNIALQSLLAEETRPTVQQVENGHLINLRGVNLNPGAMPEDMVAVRIWVSHNRIITLRRPRIQAIQAIRQDCEQGSGPRSIGDFITQLITGLIERMVPVIGALDDRLDEMEESQVDFPSIEVRNQLGDLRRQAIALKRFLAPQRDALMSLAMLQVDWLGQKHSHHIKDAHDQTSRMVEALDAIRERAAILHEEFSSQIAEKNNRNSYVLTVIAAIFLPLGFLTGLLGINVGGVPGVENPYAFIWVTLAIIVLGILEFLLLKWMRWI